MKARLRSVVCGGLVLLTALAALSCQDSNKPLPAAPEAGPTKPSATAPVSPAVPQPARLPEVTIDPSHVQIGMDELQLTVPSYPSQLKVMIGKYPVSKPEQVVVNAARTNKLPDVSTLVASLFDAGAKSIEVRTTPRGQFPGKLVLTADKAIGPKAPPCTYVGMVLKDLGLTFWHIKGGLAKRYSKGMAGPDLTMMHDSLAKEIDQCAATVFFFSAEEGVEWGHAFDLATSVVSHEPHYRAEMYVLLREIPVPGHPVKVAP
jgi:hypothetical protein